MNKTVDDLKMEIETNKKELKEKKNKTKPKINGGNI